MIDPIWGSQPSELTEIRYIFALHQVLTVLVLQMDNKLEMDGIHSRFVVCFSFICIIL